MEVSESSVSMSVNNTWVNIFFVIICVSFVLVQQTIFQHVFGSQNDRKPFIVVNVLEFSNQYSSGFLVQSFVIPMRVDVGQNCSNAVMFSEEKDLKDSQLWVLVSSSVTCNNNYIITNDFKNLFSRLIGMLRKGLFSIFVNKVNPQRPVSRSTYVLRITISTNRIGSKVLRQFVDHIRRSC